MQKERKNISFCNHADAFWTPIYTLPRNEKRVYEYLSNLGFEAYLPLKRHVNIQLIQNKGKSYTYPRILHVPMFPGYLFAPLSRQVKDALTQTRSVVRFLPLPKSSEDQILRELQFIRLLEQNEETVEFDITNGLVQGNAVELTEGAFAGWCGIVDETTNNGMVYINITSTQSAIRLKYPSHWCKKI